MKLSFLTLALFTHSCLAIHAFAATAIQYNYEVYPTGKAMLEEKGVQKEFDSAHPLTLEVSNGTDVVTVVAKLSSDGNQIDFVFTTQKNGQRVALWSASRPFTKDVKVKGDISDKKNPVPELQAAGISKVWVRLRRAP